MRNILGLAVALAIATPNTASANAAFIWADQPTRTTAYSPSPNYRGSSFPTGGVGATVQRLSVGRYRVALSYASLGAPPFPHVSAYGGPHRCQVESWLWSASLEVTVRVRCYDFDGIPTDGKFTLHVHDSQTGVADAWADQANRTVHSPYNTNSYYSSNTTPSGSPGGPPNVTRTATGAYRVRFPDWAVDGHNIMVSAYGNVPRFCNVFTHDHDAARREVSVDVWCRDQHGSYANAQFNVSIMRNTSMMPVGFHGAYARTAAPSATWHSPPTLYSHNQLWGPGSTSIHRRAPGRYSVYFREPTFTANTNALVTAYTVFDHHCVIENWGDFSIWTRVNVACYDHTSRDYADTGFFVTLSTNRR